MKTIPAVAMKHRDSMIEQLTFWTNGGGIDVDQDYQRGLVWGLTRKQNLVRSLRTGLPIGMIIVNNRAEANDYASGSDQRRAIIDGKQRVTTLIEFMEGKFAVPATFWDDKELASGTSDLVTWNDLSLIGQRRFGNTPLSVSEVALRTIAEERELFDLINFGGLAQGETDEGIVA